MDHYLSQLSETDQNPADAIFSRYQSMMVYHNGLYAFDDFTDLWVKYDEQDFALYVVTKFMHRLIDEIKENFKKKEMDSDALRKEMENLENIRKKLQHFEYITNITKYIIINLKYEPLMAIGKDPDFPGFDCYNEYLPIENSLVYNIKKRTICKRTHEHYFTKELNIGLRNLIIEN